MTELDEALTLAHRILDRRGADPDDDLAVLARQLTRQVERLHQTRDWRIAAVISRAETILANMARENEKGIAFGRQRWPIHHEPLRADAKGLLPEFDTAKNELMELMAVVKMFADYYPAGVNPDLDTAWAKACDIVRRAGLDP